MVLVRLQKYLSECGVASRRAAERLILEGEVRVNNQVVLEMGVKIDPACDEVLVGKRLIRPWVKGILLLHKPTGVVSTLHDPGGRTTVGDYLTKHFRSYFPVGRLDYDSSGLMVLTNDGELAEQLLHPRYGFERVYEVEVQGHVPEAVLNRIEHGVRLSDGFIRARVEGLRRGHDDTLIRLSISEGRNRVVRRLMDKLGFPVIKLKRISHGPFRLGSLKTGQVRKLTEKEYRQVKERISRKAESRQTNRG